MPLFPLAVLLTATIAAADLYKWVDDAGQTHYTDDPGRIPAEKRKKTKTITTKDSPPAAQSSNAGTERETQADPPLSAGGKNGSIPPPYQSTKGPKYPNLIADGEILPDADFTGLDGVRHSVRSLRGKIVLLNFWATWCGPCRNEMPSMQRLFAELGGKRDFSMLAVSEEAADKVKAFWGQQQYRFPVALAGAKQSSTRFGASSIPTTYILNRDGRVLFCQVGGIEWDEPRMAAWLRQLVETR
ncbi:MAG: redoxin family protein [Nitrospinae bacterium]|nr:redoxin family protein [Nitrospinota bacterium]